MPNCRCWRGHGGRNHRKALRVNLDCGLIAARDTEVGVTEPGNSIRTVAIIGGGFTGATVAYHLARDLRPGRADIVVIEPRPLLGQGLAYSTADPTHRINVPATRMTMDRAEAGQFQSWIDGKGIALSDGSTVEGGAFPQRGLVGRYVSDMLAPLLAQGRVRHLQHRAIGVTPGAEGYRVTLDDGTTLDAARVVIATSHPPPGIPGAFAQLQGSARLLADPSDSLGIAGIADSARRVLVVGTGLTSADVIASLDARGFTGHVTALSRRGLRSRGHAFGYTETTEDFSASPEASALALLRRIRRAVRQDLRRGLPWQATLDRVRSDGPAIWAALPLHERRKLVRRLRVWWDVHRFRIAPQVESVLDRLESQGRLNIIAGRLIAAHETPAGIGIDWRPRGQLVPRSDLFDAVILTTGPAHETILESSELLRMMAAQGLIREDPLGLGIEVTDHCRAVGTGADGILIAGPLARGHVGELMGIPEVTAHAETVAAALRADLDLVAKGPVPLA